MGKAPQLQQHPFNASEYKTRSFKKTFQLITKRFSVPSIFINMCTFALKCQTHNFLKDGPNNNNHF